MGTEEHSLVKALITNNEEMRVIAVGDDDQNIYEFRGSDYKLDSQSDVSFINSSCMIFQDAPTDQKVPQR